MRPLPFPHLRKIFSRLYYLLNRAGFAEKSALLALGLSAIAFFFFGTLAAEMSDGETDDFDKLVLLAFRSRTDLSDPIGPPWVEAMMRDFTALGSVAVLSTITLIIVGLLFLTDKRRVALAVLCSVASGVLLSHLLKWGFARPRPDLVPHGVAVYTQSFPSGHAMLSALVYLTLGSLLARTQADAGVKIYLLATAAVLTVLVGVSRVYLGVHWPTDVLAGWAIGAGWALLCWLVVLWLQGSGEVEPETTADSGDNRPC